MPDGLVELDAVREWLVDRESGGPPSGCVCPTIAEFLSTWIFRSKEAGYEPLSLGPLAPLVVGTGDDGQQARRGWMAGDWLIREHAPAWLEGAGITDAGTALRALPDVRDLVALDAARPAISEAKSAATAALDAAYRAESASTAGELRKLLWSAWRQMRGARDAAEAVAWTTTAGMGLRDTGSP